MGFCHKSVIMTIILRHKDRHRFGISAGHGCSAGGGRKERKEMAVQGRITRSVDRSAWIPKFEGQARAGGSGGFSVLTNGSLTVNILGDGCCMSNVSPPFSKYYQTNVDKFN